MIKKFEDFLLLEKEDITKEPKKSKEETYLFFNGNRLDFIENGELLKSWKAVSGRTHYHWYVKPEIWKRRFSLNLGVWSKVKNEGPTPPGIYTLGDTQFKARDSKWKTDPAYVKKVVAEQTILGLPGAENIKEKTHEFKDSTEVAAVSWGEYRWPLIPSRGTETYGRTNFYVHGGSTPGSIGCIDLVTESGDFAKFYINWQRRTGNKTIQVRVNYSTFDSKIPVEVQSQPYKMQLTPNLMNPNIWYNETDKVIVDTLAKNKILVNPETLRARKK